MSEDAAAAEVGARASTLRCFVIGPIGNRLAEHGSEARNSYEEALEVFSEVIQPACASVGLLSPVRADGLARAGEITDQIFRRLRDDDVVIADLTGANANVMYELGLRHSKHLFTAQIGEYGRLPFDINVIRTVMFSRSSMGLINARRELTEILEAGLLGEYDPVSATRVWLEGADHPASAALDPPQVSAAEGDHSSVHPEDDDEPGIVDLVAGAEDRFDDFTAAASKIQGIIQELGALAEHATEEVEASDARGGGMKGRLVVATKYAAGLDALADGLEAVVDEYEDACRSVSAGILALIGTLEADPSQLDEQSDFTSSIRGLAQIARESLGSLAGMTDSMKENSKISRVMRAPTRRITSAFDRFSATSSSIDEWDRRLQALGVPVPPADEEP
jgi:hypothetical protein